MLQKRLHKLSLSLFFLSFFQLGFANFISKNDTLATSKSNESNLNTWQWDKGSLKERIFETHFISFKDAGVKFTLDPEFEQFVGLNSDWYRNGRGFSLTASSEKLYVSTKFLEVQDYNPTENISAVYNQTLSAAGHGRWKRFKDTGYDYSRVSAYAVYALKNNWRISGGYAYNNHLPFSDYASNSTTFLSQPYIRSDWSPSGKYIWQSKFVLSHTFSRQTDIQRLPSTASAEAQFFSKRSNTASVLWKPKKWVFLRLNDTHISFREELDGTRNKMNSADFNFIPGLTSLLEPNNTRRNSTQEFTVGFSNMFSDSSWVPPIRVQGSLLNSTESGMIFGYAFKFSMRIVLNKTRFKISESASTSVASLGFLFQFLKMKEDGNVVPYIAHLGYTPGMLNVMPQQYTLELTPRYKRIEALLSVILYEKHIPGNEDEGSIINANIGYTLNPKTGLNIRAGYIGHTAYNALSNFYLSLSTQFGSNKFDF